MWKEDFFNINDISVTPQSIYVVVKVNVSFTTWFKCYIC